MYKKVRINLTRIFVGFIILLVVFSDSQWEEKSSLTTGILFLLGCVFAGIASVGRLWCTLYIAGFKTKRLVTEGPYSICRNPLYFFSLFGGIGVGLATETLTIPLILLIAFAIYYPFVIRHEENKLKAVHGEEFEAYFRTVPRFWPKWSLLEEPEEYTVTPLTFRKHSFQALWFIWMIGILEMIEMLHELNIIKPCFKLF